MTNNYINLQEDETQNNIFANKDQNHSPESEPDFHHEEAPSVTNSQDKEGEMSDIEMEMFTVAESAFNRKRAQAHEEIDKLYDEMIRSAKDKVKGITASIVAEVSGQ